MEGLLRASLSGHQEETGNDEHARHHDDAKSALAENVILRLLAGNV